MGSKTHLRALGFSSGSSFSNSLNLALTALTGTGTAPKDSMLTRHGKDTLGIYCGGWAKMARAVDDHAGFRRFYQVVPANVVCPKMPSMFVLEML